VDDDPATRELFTTYLTVEGYTVASASSGSAAIEDARRLLPDVIVTDVLMPGPGGAQTLFVLRNTPETSEIPTIVVSGISERVLELMSAAAYLVKPVDRQTLVEAVRKCIYSTASNRT
jgi:CheY-like chemotaxis protein